MFWLFRQVDCRMICLFFGRGSVFTLLTPLHNSTINRRNETEMAEGAGGGKAIVCLFGQIKNMMFLTFARLLRHSSLIRHRHSSSIIDGSLRGASERMPLSCLQGMGTPPNLPRSFVSVCVHCFVVKYYLFITYTFDKQQVDWYVRAFKHPHLLCWCFNIQGRPRHDEGKVSCDIFNLLSMWKAKYLTVFLFLLLQWHLQCPLH